MILRWTDAAHGQHYLDDIAELTLLSTWGIADELPEPERRGYGEVYGPTVVYSRPPWAGPPASREPIQDPDTGEVTLPGARELALYLAATVDGMTVLYRLEVSDCYLMTDAGDTIDVLARTGR